jgi:2',3'-cyclic-nucleotide 2'-phosphodiesterase (5'-nucleotidase family)
MTVADDGGKRTVAWWPDFRIIDTATAVPDPAMAARVAAVQGQLDSEIDTPIARLAAPLDLREPLLRGAEAAVGNLFTDALRQGMDADVAVLDGGGIRGDKVLAAGRSLTRRDVMAALPFNNTAALLQMEGRTLRQAFEEAFADALGLTPAFPQVSGLTIKADLSRPAGQRVVAVTVNGVPLDDGRLYSVATSDYLARGGDGYAAFKDARRLVDPEDGKLLTGIVIDYLARLGTIDAKVDGRVVVARSTPLP